MQRQPITCPAARALARHSSDIEICPQVFNKELLKITTLYFFSIFAKFWFFYWYDKSGIMSIPEKPLLANSSTATNDQIEFFSIAGFTMTVNSLSLLMPLNQTTLFCNTLSKQEPARRCNHCGQRGSGGELDFECCLGGSKLISSEIHLFLLISALFEAHREPASSRLNLFPSKEFTWLRPRSSIMRPPHGYD